MRPTADTRPARGGLSTYFVLLFIRMKERVTLTLDPAVGRRAKLLARQRGTSVSALVETYLRTTPLSGEARMPFAQRWTGRFHLATSHPGDALGRALRGKYGLGGR